MNTEGTEAVITSVVLRIFHSNFLKCFTEVEVTSRDHGAGKGEGGGGLATPQILKIKKN